MGLRPRQIIGLAAIVVGGAVVVLRLTQPSEREIVERRFASLPSVSVPPETPLAIPVPPVSILAVSDPAPPTPDLPAPQPPSASAISRPLEQDDAMPGSQDAKDDLYCWAVLNREFDTRIKTDPAAATPLLDAAKRLEAAGVKKLEAEGVTGLDNWASLTVAYAEKARADYRQGALRIPVAACLARASVLAREVAP